MLIFRLEATPDEAVESVQSRRFASDLRERFVESGAYEERCIICGKPTPAFGFWVDRNDTLGPKETGIVRVLIYSMCWKCDDRAQEKGM